MKFTLLATAVVIALGALKIMAIDYFADGCMVWDNRGKLVQTSPGVFEFRSTVRCEQLIIKTERGKKRAGWH